MGQKHANWRAELVEDLSAEIRNVDAAWKQQAIQKRELESLDREVRGHIEGQLESLRNEVAVAARQSDLEEVQRLFEKAHRRLGDDLIAHQQRLISELRSETTAALKDEADHVAALDEQVWLSDQRLGQRVDKVDQQCRECTKNLEEVARSHNDIMRSHKESMSRIKGLAIAHREHFRSHSPEPSTLLEALRSPQAVKSPRVREDVGGSWLVDKDGAARASSRVSAFDEDRAASERVSRGLGVTRHADAAGARSSSFNTRGHRFTT